ncbi:hypothetical protein BESB_076340 [Besnoitia besnoiti]|uniref:Uncharacterized protein n=1 Tax=Besnoitia besnoiti TaxID=94643 RepID=A0A2A9MCU4_BESBE|nr:hypothetical protein BESB_076340 [Besnoitia besnoiti]PFH33417.1 hypothetical protein BESB_076340 [Besnoitia besnoiti]
MGDQLESRASSSVHTVFSPLVCSASEPSVPLSTAWCSEALPNSSGISPPVQRVSSPDYLTPFRPPNSEEKSFPHQPGGDAASTTCSTLSHSLSLGAADLDSAGRLSVSDLSPPDASASGLQEEGLAPAFWAKDCQDGGGHFRRIGCAPVAEGSPSVEEGEKGRNAEAGVALACVAAFAMEETRHDVLGVPSLPVARPEGIDAGEMREGTRAGFDSFAQRVEREMGQKPETLEAAAASQDASMNLFGEVRVEGADAGSRVLETANEAVSSVASPPREARHANATSSPFRLRLSSQRYKKVAVKESLVQEGAFLSPLEAHEAHAPLLEALPRRGAQEEEDENLSTVSASPAGDFTAEDFLMHTASSRAGVSRHLAGLSVSSSTHLEAVRLSAEASPRGESGVSPSVRSRSRRRPACVSPGRHAAETAARTPTCGNQVLTPVEQCVVAGEDRLTSDASDAVSGCTSGDAQGVSRRAPERVQCVTAEAGELVYRPTKDADFALQASSPARRDRSPPALSQQHVGSCAASVGSTSIGDPCGGAGSVSEVPSPLAPSSVSFAGSYEASSGCGASSRLSMCSSAWAEGAEQLSSGGGSQEVSAGSVLATRSPDRRASRASRGAGAERRGRGGNGGGVSDGLHHQLLGGVRGGVQQQRQLSSLGGGGAAAAAGRERPPYRHGYQGYQAVGCAASAPQALFAEGAGALSPAAVSSAHRGRSRGSGSHHSLHASAHLYPVRDFSASRRGDDSRGAGRRRRDLDWGESNESPGVAGGVAATGRTRDFRACGETRRGPEREPDTACGAALEAGKTGAIRDGEIAGEGAEAEGLMLECEEEVTASFSLSSCLLSMASAARPGTPDQSHYVRVLTTSASSSVRLFSSVSSSSPLCAPSKKRAKDFDSDQEDLAERAEECAEAPRGSGKPTQDEGALLNCGGAQPQGPIPGETTAVGGEGGMQGTAFLEVPSGQPAGRGHSRRQKTASRSRHSSAARRKGEQQSGRGGKQPSGSRGRGVNQRHRGRGESTNSCAVRLTAEVLLQLEEMSAASVGSPSTAFPSLSLGSGSSASAHVAFRGSAPSATTSSSSLRLPAGATGSLALGASREKDDEDFFWLVKRRAEALREQSGEGRRRCAAFQRAEGLVSSCRGSTQHQGADGGEKLVDGDQSTPPLAPANFHLPSLAMASVRGADLLLPSGVTCEELASARRERGDAAAPAAQRLRARDGGDGRQSGRGAGSDLTLLSPFPFHASAAQVERRGDVSRGPGGQEDDCASSGSQASSEESTKGTVNHKCRDDNKHINLCANPSDMWYGLMTSDGKPVCVRPRANRWHANNSRRQRKQHKEMQKRLLAQAQNAASPPQISSRAVPPAHHYAKKGGGASSSHFHFPGSLRASHAPGAGEGAFPSQPGGGHGALSLGGGTPSASLAHLAVPAASGFGGLGAGAAAASRGAESFSLSLPSVSPSPAPEGGRGAAAAAVGPQQSSQNPRERGSGSHHRHQRRQHKKRGRSSSSTAAVVGISASPSSSASAFPLSPPAFPLVASSSSSSSCPVGGGAPGTATAAGTGGAGAGGALHAVAAQQHGSSRGRRRHHHRHHSKKGIPAAQGANGSQQGTSAASHAFPLHAPTSSGALGGVTSQVERGRGGEGGMAMSAQGSSGGAVPPIDVETANAFPCASNTGRADGGSHCNRVVFVSAHAAAAAGAGHFSGVGGGGAASGMPVTRQERAFSTSLSSSPRPPAGRGAGVAPAGGAVEGRGGQRPLRRARLDEAGSFVPICAPGKATGSRAPQQASTHAAGEFKVPRPVVFPPGDRRHRLPKSHRPAAGTQLAPVAATGGAGAAPGVVHAEAAGAGRPASGSLRHERESGLFARPEEDEAKVPADTASRASRPLPSYGDLEGYEDAQNAGRRRSLRAGEQGAAASFPPSEESGNRQATLESRGREQRAAACLLPSVSLSSIPPATLSSSATSLPSAGASPSAAASSAQHSEPSPAYGVVVETGTVGVPSSACLFPYARKNASGGASLPPAAERRRSGSAGSRRGGGRSDSDKKRGEKKAKKSTAGESQRPWASARERVQWQLAKSRGLI